MDPVQQPPQQTEETIETYDDLCPFLTSEERRTINLFAQANPLRALRVLEVASNRLARSGIQVMQNNIYTQISQQASSQETSIESTNAEYSQAESQNDLKDSSEIAAAALLGRASTQERVVSESYRNQRAKLIKDYYHAADNPEKLKQLLQQIDVSSRAPQSLFDTRLQQLNFDLLSDGQIQESLDLTDAQKSRLLAKQQVLKDEQQHRQEKTTQTERDRAQLWAERLLRLDANQREEVFIRLLDRQMYRSTMVDGLLWDEETKTRLIGKIPWIKNLAFIRKHAQKSVRHSILSKKQLKVLLKKEKNDGKNIRAEIKELFRQKKEASRKKLLLQKPLQKIEAAPEFPLVSNEPFDEGEDLLEDEGEERDEERNDKTNSIDPQDILNKYKRAKNIADKTSKFAKRFFGNGAVDGEAAAGTSTAIGGFLAGISAPEIVAGLLFVLAFILIVGIVILLVFVLGNQGGNQYTAPISFATCGDASIGANDANLFAKEFNKRYQKNKYYGIILTAGGGDNATLLQGETEFYSDLCVLFGHLQGFSYQPDTYNTFGTLVMGSPKQIQNMQTVGIHITITAADTIDPCYFKLNNLTNDTSSWTFFYNASCSTGRARFLVTQNLAHDLILQQQHLTKVHASPSQVYNNFTSTYGSNIMTKSTLLPTNDCLNNSNYGEGAKDQQNRDCFADMAATYATYPIYYDSPTPTTAPLTSSSSTTQNNTASQSAAFTSPLSNFPQGSYVDYYNFAKDFLFDGIDFYASPNDSGTILTWADTIDKRLTKAGGTNFDQFTPGANQDLTTCELKVDPIKGNFKDTESPGPQCPTLFRAYKGGDLMYTVRRRGVPGRTDPSNKLRYWCTDFVIDVFNLGSGKRLLSEGLGMVVYMQRFFAQQSTNPQSGVGFLNYDKDHHVLSQVKPGAAIFFLQTNDGQPHEAEHTGIVTSISIDNNGNGSIHTDEANNMGANPQYVYPVSNWNVENAPFPVRGFGFLQ